MNECGFSCEYVSACFSVILRCEKGIGLFCLFSIVTKKRREKIIVIKSKEGICVCDQSASGCSILGLMSNLIGSN